MFRSLLTFIGYILAISFTGILVLFLSLAFLPDSREPEGISLLLMIVSVILTYGSPVIVGFWFWRERTLSKARLNQENQNKAVQVAEQESARRRFFERERLIDAIDHHRTALVRNLDRAFKKNDYGAIVEDRRHEALYEFFASIDLDTDAIDYPEAVELVSEQLASHQTRDRATGFDTTTIPVDGHAFEHWVADALTGFGWEAEVTSAGGDQGIDVIATKAGRKLCVQCKLYSSAIGNKAVQEAHAGKAYYGADRAAVLSNAPFTSSAQALAISTGVLLVSHHDIPQLFEKAFEI